MLPKSLKSEQIMKISNTLGNYINSIDDKQDIKNDNKDIKILKDEL